MSDAPGRRIAPADRRDAAGTIRLTIVSIMRPGDGLRLRRVHRGRPARQHRRALRSRPVARRRPPSSAVWWSRRPRSPTRLADAQKSGRTRLPADHVAELAAAVASSESSERDRGAARLLKRLDVTRAALGVATNPAIREQLVGRWVRGDAWSTSSGPRAANGIVSMPPASSACSAARARCSHWRSRSGTPTSTSRTRPPRPSRSTPSDRAYDALLDALGRAMRFPRPASRDCSSRSRCPTRARTDRVAGLGFGRSGDAITGPRTCSEAWPIPAPRR